MRSLFLIFPFFAGLIALVTTTEARKRLSRRAVSASQLVYPKVHRVDKTWSYPSAKANGNVTYSDPYFWLEGRASDKDIEQFVQDQNAITEEYVKGCKGKDAITKSLTQASTYDKYKFVQQVSSIIEGVEPFYLYSLVRSGDQPRVWYTATMEEWQSAKKNNFNPPPGKPFLDEALLSDDGSQSILYQSASPDGKVFAYLVIGNGEVGTWYFRNFDTPLIKAKTKPAGGEGRLNDTLPLSADDPAWLPSGKGIFYPMTVESDAGTNPNHGYKIQYHEWGTENSKDITIFDAANAGPHGQETFYFIQTSPDGRWLTVSGYYEGTDVNMTSYATLLPGQEISSNMKWISLAPDYEFPLYAIGVINESYYFQTSKDNAKNQKVSKIKLDWTKARQVKQFTELQDRPEVIDVIPERKDASISQFSAWATASNKIVVLYIENGQNTIYLYCAISGKKLEQLLPNENLIFGEIQSDQNSDTMIIRYESWNTPAKIYEFTWKDDHLDTSLATIRLIEGSNPDDFAIEELYATSKDGTKIPYFLTHRKGTKRDGSAPAWVHGYGFYGLIDNLFYEPNYFDFLRSYGGYFVWICARGGGDLGGAWHDAAIGVKRQRTFDDYLAVVQDLVRLKITSPGNIILEGGSGGAMAAGAVMNQAPEGLLGVVLPVRGPLDVIQFELRSAIGAGNRAEFGDVTTPDGFDAVFAWSPLQNIDPNKQYPAVLLTPGTADERVPPSYSYKFVAQLQYDHPKNNKPLLMYVVKNRGHVPSNVVESIYQLCIIEEYLGISRVTA